MNTVDQAASKIIRGLLALALLAGCNAGIGTAAELPTVRMDYNEAIVRSSNEQLLLNLVRLRYLHAPQFFEVSSVTVQSWMTSGGSASLGGSLGGLPDTPALGLTGGVGGSLSLSNRPTVSYSPLQGEAFAQRMVRPIQPETLFTLVNVGWRIDRLFACCVTRINDMSAPIIASDADDFGGARFTHLANLLYELQTRGALEIGLIRIGDGQELRMTFVPTDDSPHVRAMIAEVQELLQLDPSLASYRVLSYHPPAPPPAPVAPTPVAVTAEGAAVTPPPTPAPVESAGANHIVVRGRSLLGALLYLSHGVQVIDGDGAARSLGYNDAAGEPVVVPNPVPEALLGIRLTRERPAGSYVSTSYRDRWYSIGDDDLHTKQTFLLLQVLFSVLSAPGNSAPMLTIPIGG